MTDERAVTTTVTYTMAIAVTTVLVSGLVIAAGSAVSDQRERAVRNELGVVGERLAAELEGADRLVADREAELRLRTTHPARLAGARYTVALVAGPSGPCDRSPCLALNASNPETSVTITLANATPVRSTAVSGGDVVVAYEPENGTLALEGTA
ncbi:DUF7266 family protein [Halorussus marinus]|uniref:DUF7266 family protein n=1 Tax=Halorussus marinus TaxID=2505976 RepID=UPI00106E05E4|nr:hypothetical protein [Halorussus marinus]